MCLRAWRSLSRPSANTSRPSKTTRPSVGGCSRRMVFTSVDLPQPDSPTMPSTSPWRMSRLTPSTAFTDRLLRVKNSFFTGKYFFSPVASSSTPASAPPSPRALRSGRAAQSSSFVYSCCGLSSSRRTGPRSTMRPRWRMPISSQTADTRPRLLAMNSTRDPELLLQLLDQLQDAGLDGDVQVAGGLVGDDQLGAAGEGHGDDDPLPLAAGQLVRVLAQDVPGVGQLHLADHLHGEALRLPGARGPGSVE